MKKWLLTLLVLIPTVSESAEVVVAIQKATAQVYSGPSTTSDVLATLKKGSKVKVSGITEDGTWAKVSIVISGFKFDGWLLREAITKPKAAPAPQVSTKSKITTPVAPTPVKPTANSALSKSSTTELEKFFEPSAGSKSNSAPAVQAESSVTQNNEPAPTSKPVKPKKVKSVRERSEKPSGDSWTKDKLDLYGVPGYSFLQYTLSDDTTEAFRYTLGGISVEVGGEYHAYQWFNDLIRASAQLNIQYDLYRTQTNLLDGSSAKFGDITSSNALLDAWFKLKFLFNFDKIVSKPFLIGLSGGYQYTKFFGDDLVQDDGTHEGLFVGQTISSVPIGIITELHFLDPVTLTLGADVLMMNSVSESPQTSGSNPKASIGFSPYLHLIFPIAEQHHFMGLNYRLRAQSVDFTGPTSSRVNSTLTNASALTIQHNVGLEYSYHF